MIAPVPFASSRATASPSLSVQPQNAASGEAVPALPQDAYERDFPAAHGATLTGNVRIHRSFESKYLAHPRDVRVYLPPGYDAHPERRYPVLYMHDGQNLFDAATSAFGTEWGVDEAAQRLMQEGRLKDVIIVAVDNTPDRMGEYTPVPDPRHGGGHADAYGRFLVEELKPYVDARLRTSASPHDTGVAGSSLGGLCSLYLGWKYPDVFGLVAALSPSMWWGHRAMVGALAQAPPNSGPERVWIDMGTAEDPEDADHNGVPDVLDDIRSAGNVMLSKGYKPGENLFYAEIPGATHSEGAWSERIGDVLVALYGPPAS